MVFPAKRSDGTPYAALRFSGNPAAGELRLLSELDSILARPVPLPSPQEMGMDGVSIPGPVMDGVRKQMGTILSGLDVTLRLNPPGAVARADGFDAIEDGVARIRVDASRGATAFQSHAGVLTDAAALTSPDVRWQWEPAAMDSALVREFRTRRNAAVEWFNGN